MRPKKYLSNIIEQEGTRINAGDIISDYAVAYDPRNRTSEKAKLSAKLVLAICLKEIKEDN